MMFARILVLGLAACLGLMPQDALGLMPQESPASSRNDKSPKPGEVKATEYEVETFKSIMYRTDKEADKDRHKLDVYCPKDLKDFPVVLFVHGGGWDTGTKNLYWFYGEEFAKLGIGFVVCNYRLSPAVKHPAHIQDVARAFAWTFENIGKYGGDTKRIFVCGHSAGGHLVSLLATDPKYLKAEKHSPEDIRGVISISGVYKIYASERVFHSAFGKDEELCKDASPLSHVDGKHPPFLIAYAEDDIPHLDEMAKDMHNALTKAGSPSKLLLCKRRDHATIMVGFLVPDDSLHKEFREFVLGKGK